MGKTQDAHQSTKGRRLVQRRQRPVNEVQMTDLRIGDRFVFDGNLYTVAEPPQAIWGVVELWVEELDWPLQGSESSTVEPTTT